MPEQPLNNSKIQIIITENKTKIETPSLIEEIPRKCLDFHVNQFSNKLPSVSSTEM